MYTLEMMDSDGDACAPAYIGRSAAVDQAETTNTDMV